MKMIDCIYLMGGIGKRAKLGYPKQFVYLGGKPLFLYGLDVLFEIKEIRNIIIPTADREKITDYLESYGYLTKKYDPHLIIFVENGASRQESVKNALKEIETEYVLISEAVRPFVTKELVYQVLENDNDIITPVSKMKATLTNKNYGMTYSRKDIGEVQMPQKFLTQLLREAYTKIETATSLKLEDCTDDCDLVNRVLGNGIKAIEGIEENIKITTPLDIKIAEAIYGYKYGGKNE